MPIKDEFKVYSARDVKRSVEKTVASQINVVMARPLSINSPSFVLMAYGTDQKFNYESVMRRWEFIVLRLRQLGIEVLGFSSDGDSRLLKAMRISGNIPTELPFLDDFCGWDFFNGTLKPVVAEQHMNSIRKHYARPAGYIYQSQGSNITDLTHNRLHPITGNSSPPVINCVQDTVHIGGKLKNRLLYREPMTLGDIQITSAHLLQLIESSNVSEHGITQSEIQTKDHMNYKIAEKLIDEKLITALKNNVPGSDGTVFYLNLMRLIRNSFDAPNISPSARLYDIWFALFAFRYWRRWLRKNNIPLERCITANAYQCIEVNAHSLVNIIMPGVLQFRTYNVICDQCVFLILLELLTCCQMFSVKHLSYYLLQREYVLRSSISMKSGRGGKPNSISKAAVGVDLIAPVIAMQICL
ncbi:uncharacterized protein LOC129808541 [Phlebotomus papatasi]|uniref:uncharacterized protein LOC129808541 n=1 Tax=Phlebotomus papatasi TaxID=29031 RepID=UPI0024834C49|nr:uncharacterized protein LOC129808541 [Phlebotomus papatasi]